MASQDGSHPFQWHYGEIDDKNFQIHGRSSILLLVVVIALLIFFTLLCLYAKWACRYRRLAAAVSRASQNESHESPSAPSRMMVVVVAGLDRDTINSLPVQILSSSADETQCSICLSNLAEGEKVKVMPGCNHGFHPECVDEWLKGQSSCPLCRASLIAGSA